MKAFHCAQERTILSYNGTEPGLGDWMQPQGVSEKAPTPAPTQCHMHSSPCRAVARLALPLKSDMSIRIYTGTSLERVTGALAAGDATQAVCLSLAPPRAVGVHKPLHSV